MIKLTVPLAVGLINTEPAGAVAEILFTLAPRRSGEAPVPMLPAVESSTTVA